MEADKKRNKKWNLQYEKLVEFQQQNGHCIVPQRHEQDKPLGQWVRKQRKNQTNNILPQNRKDLLDDIGFIWRVQADENWLLQYQKLVEFKRTSGHCIVPLNYEQDKALGRWVNTQRNLQANNTLQTIRQDRKDLLVALDFVWNVQDHDWHLHYEKLKDFQREHGHCIVPHSYEPDKALGPWVAMQRNLHTKQDMMPDDRKVLFDDIGFVWKVDVDKKWREKH